ncbi:MAG TPA: hypothetical protein VMM78_02825 [Thermomicrobiales bacterium]|nr:hypothetical protein [Thermomicrobiales bacterium]
MSAQVDAREWILGGTSMDGDDRLEDGCDDEVARLLRDVGQRGLSRRELLYRSIVLGLSIPVIGWLLTTLEDGDAPRV